MLWVYKEIHFSIKINQAQIHAIQVRWKLYTAQLNNPQQLDSPGVIVFVIISISDCCKL